VTCAPGSTRVRGSAAGAGGGCCGTRGGLAITPRRPFAAKRRVRTARRPRPPFTQHFLPAPNQTPCLPPPARTSHPRRQPRDAQREDHAVRARAEPPEEGGRRHIRQQLHRHPPVGATGGSDRADRFDRVDRVDRGAARRDASRGGRRARARSGPTATPSDSLWPPPPHPLLPPTASKNDNARRITNVVMDDERKQQVEIFLGWKARSYFPTLHLPFRWGPEGGRTGVWPGRGGRRKVWAAGGRPALGLLAGLPCRPATLPLSP
jgi:hypothetical protein